MGLALVVFTITLSVADAHVVVSPKTAPGNTYQIFSVGVPSERLDTTVGLRLLIPSGVQSVRPNVKPGWQIMFTSEKINGKDVVTEISWTGGKVPPAFRDDFYFSVKTPTSSPLIWKAYQTYADGTVVSWDQEPVSNATSSHDVPVGPYSETTIVGVSTDHSMHTPDSSASMSMPMSGSSHLLHYYLLPILAIVIALIAYFEVAKKI